MTQRVPRPDAAGDRRSLASRQTGWARALAARAAARGVTPNAISIASMGFAALAASGLGLAAAADGGVTVAGLLLGALGIQLRLLCNLIDGMVAIEGGRAGPTGALWNELPDRLSDALVLVAAGVLADAAALGWAAAAAAICTAYVRELGHRLTGVADFSGWMAKPQRMALMTLACVIGAAGVPLGGPGVSVVFRLALGIVVLGATWVALARSRRLLIALGASRSS